MTIGAVLTTVVVAGAICAGTYAFLAESSPYVTAKVARTRPGSSCNVAGDLLHDTVRNDLTSNELHFSIKDSDGEILPVVYKGSKPGNFDSAPRVSVLGTYQSGEFQAERILVKCPSKYQSKGDNYAQNRS